MSIFGRKFPEEKNEWASKTNRINYIKHKFYLIWSSVHLYSTQHVYARVFFP